MAASSIRCRFGRYVAGTLLALMSQAVLSAPGFIAGSRVSGDASNADIEIRFNCKVSYLQHDPQQQGDSLRIHLYTTSICNGVSPLAAMSRGRYRPVNADLARIIDFEYDGDGTAGPTLTLNFSEPVTFDVDAPSLSFALLVHVAPAPASEQKQAADANRDIPHRQVIRPLPATPVFVVNLASFQRIPTIADAPNLRLAENQRVFYSEAMVDGSTWYRLRLGDFQTATDARNAMDELKAIFPAAWVDQPGSAESAIDLTVAAQSVATVPGVSSAGDAAGNTTAANEEFSKIDLLMDEARQTMISGDRSRAIQIYTKILQMPEHPRQAEAQEYLALAREKNGQNAHAKAEYQRYLSLYPEHDGAARVSQRLAALLASNRQVGTSGVDAALPARARQRQANDWRLQTYVSQYYRRDVNQPSDNEEIVSQSALYTDINFDARRRGERFDFSSRLTAGYRSDFLSEGAGSGNETRISYAYADLADAVTGLRARVGRQSRNSGGVLGRFDGLNFGYQATERVLVNAVVGSPAYSSSDGIDSTRTFYGASVEYGPLLDGLELGLFFIQQDINGFDDRRAVGGEFRYFGSNQSVWGLVDYDTLYKELGSAFLQASWRFASRLTLNGSFDRRHSPFLSAGNALIGQPVTSFAQLMEIYPAEDIRQFSIDRSPLSTTLSVGLSYSLSPKIQISADTNQTSVEATPASGGVLETPESRFEYFAMNVVASSLLKEGDVTIIGVRHSSSDTSNVVSLTLDSRFPFGRAWRINPRLRVDRRERSTEANPEWIYTPGIRIQFRRSQKFRLELQAGKQFAQRETVDLNLDRESYFFNLGYQFFF